MKTKYLCEQCGTMYDTKAEAVACENQHGKLIEFHVMPGKAYTREKLRPNVVYAKFRNKFGEEEAAQYQFICYEDVDFEVTKREQEEADRQGT